MLRLRIDDGTADLVSSLLWDADTTGIAEIDDVVLAGFPDRETAEAVAARAAAWPVTVLAIEASDWSGTDEVTSVVVGSDRPGSPVPRHDLLIVAGPTFGHGGHHTSALAIDLVTRAAVERAESGDGVAVLDVGTGSGVVAIAAAVVGAGPVVGIDIDPAAIEVAAGNAERNGVDVLLAGATVEAARRLAPDRGFDLVVANVLLPVQRQLAPSMAAVVAPGGSLITTGYLSTDGDEVAELHRAAIEGAGGGPVVVAVEAERDGWAAHRFDLGPAR